ncbi:MAG TPA: CsbD family protein [Frateuria sp.]|uniref:CsbD family protein n=1 Tax=Frateuria sp. TaxID=2211372 RepID=UPI002D7EBD64|nr:CsbD family protein [Frateuria sp.]HET6804196.1 CsbD family protein [Frateuria sp.]
MEILEAVQWTRTGSAKQIKGSIMEAVGKAAGDTKLQSEGKADQAEGKIQNAVGGLKDTVRDAVKK